MEMRDDKNNFIIILFVLMQFEMSAVCDLHGFSPQGGISERGGRIRRDAQSFYNSLMYDKERLYQFSKNGDMLTREVRIKQGRLKGFIKEFKNNKLKDVEVFWGIPYATPPVNSLRFMPPGSPPTWKDLRVFDTFGPVCPQSPPDLTNEPFKTMNAGYFNRLKGLMPFLSNQSEDCLYLNIYAPMQDSKPKKKYPVIVYVHGESFEWNSGNPYDGSVLASYGNVVVVTINFRLGILGFLRPGLSEHTVSNFGLLDQIAALQWIKDNIEEFGGDPSSVTLMGHGTGAACINFLMVSPVSMASQGLFHKAILMSGTALADWALTQNPLQFTIQVAEALNCPLVDKNEELSNCLRKKRLSEIMSVKITAPDFQTPFGPTVDGSVVPNTPHQVMGVYQNLFTRYDLLYGLTEWESYHLLDPVSLTYGMLESERNEFLRKYMYSRYEALPFFALATTLSKYLDWRKSIPQSKSTAEEHRDLTLDLLSDAMYAAPVIQMALYHSKINPKSYFYIFKHKNKMGEFAGSERSISGEEIAYVFGIPLINEEGPLAHHKFSLSEQLLSESVLTYFTNFAKTGNPNAPGRTEYLFQGPKDWQHYDVYWPEYDAVNQTYLSIEIPPHLDHHYRFEMTQFWNKILPDLLSNPTKVTHIKPKIPSEETFKHQDFHVHKKEREDSDQWTYGSMHFPQGVHQKGKGKNPQNTEEHPLSKQMDRPFKDVGANQEKNEMSASSVSYLIATSVCLLILNVVVIGVYCYKKRKTNTRTETVTLKNVEEEDFTNIRKSAAESLYSSVDGSTDANAKNTKLGRLKMCLNNSTEKHAKVKKWLQQEIQDKCSKTKKTSKVPETKGSASEGSSRSTPLPKPILKTPQKPNQSKDNWDTVSRKSVQKVSIGIDATPSTRGASVLQQIPIEITKSLDRGLLKIGPSDKTPLENLRGGSRTSISLQMLPTNSAKFVTSTEPEIIELKPKSRQTFSEDINVTSRDSTLIPEPSSEDPLENIQRRNFPKVLPDFPEAKPKMRFSLQQPSDLYKNKSNPPPPPPRVSTLQREKTKSQEVKEENPKFSTFSKVEFKKPEEDKEDTSESSTTDSSKKSVILKPEVKKEKKRERPSIVIQPKIGPGKSNKKKSPKMTRINLQNELPKQKDFTDRILDSKGPSDKVG